MRIKTAAFLTSLTTTLLGCGPTVSGVRIVQANISLSAAEMAGAPTAAPYEYTAAQEYLRKAREENAYSDFDSSSLFADKAIQLAEQARMKAEKSARMGTTAPRTTP